MPDDAESEPKVSVSYSWAYQLIATLIGIILAYASLRNDLNTALKEAHETSMIAEKTREEVNLLKYNQGITQQMLSDFRVTYERDMSRYIRETPTR